MFCIIRLIDHCVGTEPEDFTSNKVKIIQKMKSLLQEYSSQRLKDDPGWPDRSRVKELVSQVIIKWNEVQKRHSDKDAYFEQLYMKSKKEAVQYFADDESLDDD